MVVSLMTMPSNVLFVMMIISWPMELAPKSPLPNQLIIVRFTPMKPPVNNVTLDIS